MAVDIDEFDTIYDLAKKVEVFRKSIPFPVKPVRPQRIEFRDNSSWGIALDKYEDEFLPKWELEKKNYHAFLIEVDKEFKEALFKFLGIENSKNREKLWQMAYENGHSEGYPEIARVAESLAELLR